MRKYYFDLILDKNVVESFTEKDDFKKVADELDKNIKAEDLNKIKIRITTDTDEIKDENGQAVKIAGEALDNKNNNMLSICPSCGSKKFNDRLGLCVDCGYDEKAWGSINEDDDYDDESSESLAKPVSEKTSADNNTPNIGADLKDILVNKYGFNAKDIDDSDDTVVLFGDPENWEVELSGDEDLDEIAQFIYEEAKNEQKVDKHDINESMKGFVGTYCDECGKKNRVEVEFKDSNKPFENTIYTCSHCGAKNLLTDPHKYNDDGTIKESLSDQYIDENGYVDTDNIANYVTDRYDGDLDDRYSCINSLIDSFKEEGKVSTEIIDQFAGALNLTDKDETMKKDVKESYVEDAPGEYTVWSSSDLVDGDSKIPLVKVKTNEDGTLEAIAVGDDEFDTESLKIAQNVLETAKKQNKSVKDTLTRLDKTLNHNDPFFSVEFDRSIINNGYELLAAQTLRTIRDDLKAAANLKSATEDSLVDKYKEFTGVDYYTDKIVDKEQYDTILGLQGIDSRDKYRYVYPEENKYIQRLKDLTEDLIEKVLLKQDPDFYKLA